jgi:hypothetical protein
VRRFVVFTGVDTEFTPVFRGIRGRVAIYNENIRAIADRYDCIVADQWALKEVQDMRFFDDDRLHYNALGHHEIARMVLRALNVPNDLQPMQPDPLPQLTWREARTNDLVWARTHFVPWVLRRLRHQSSGDNITAKRPSRCRSPSRLRPATAPRPRSAGLAQGPERHRRGGDVERVDAAGHRDRDDRVGRGQRAPRQPVAFGAQSSATCGGRAAANASRATASSASARAARWSPASCSRSRPALQPPSASSGRRVHGTWNTVPMLTRTLRR